MATKNALSEFVERIRRIEKNPNHYARLKAVFDELDPQGARDTPLPTELPLVAPERWRDRADKSEAVPQFVQRVWGPWLEAGLLTQGALQRHPVTREPLDSGLRSAIYQHCRVTGEEPTSIIPTKWKKGNAREALKLLRAGDLEGALQRASIQTLSNYLARNLK